MRITRAEVTKQLEETAKKVEEVMRLTSLSEQIIEYVDEMLTYRPPARVYALYLKEQWYKFQIKCCVSQQKGEIQNPSELCELYFNSLPQRKNLICELYLQIMCYLKS
jgi:hypothetical protein